jgi:hypothetical protein
MLRLGFTGVAAWQLTISGAGSRIKRMCERVSAAEKMESLALAVFNHKIDIDTNR